MPAPQTRAPSPPPGRPVNGIITPPERRHLEAQEQLQLLFSYCPELAHVHELIRQFATMVDQRDATGLPG